MSEESSINCKKVIPMSYLRNGLDNRLKYVNIINYKTIEKEDKSVEFVYKVTLKSDADPKHIHRMIYDLGDYIYFEIGDPSSFYFKANNLFTVGSIDLIRTFYYKYLEYIPKTVYIRSLGEFVNVNTLVKDLMEIINLELELLGEEKRYDRDTIDNADQLQRNREWFEN